MPNVAGIDDAVKKRRVAEVRFLRAHHYFVLVEMYGAVPLVLAQNTTANKTATRTPMPEVYAAIVKDLETALSNLATPTTDYGRATKGACEYLLARVYLTKATSEPTAPDNYNKAATYAQNVIKNYSYRLLSDFASVFAQDAGEISDEVIFATQYTSDPTTNGAGNETHLFFGMGYDVQAGMKRDIFYGRPFKRFRPARTTRSTPFSRTAPTTRATRKAFAAPIYPAIRAPAPTCLTIPKLASPLRPAIRPFTCPATKCPWPSASKGPTKCWYRAQPLPHAPSS